MSELEPDRRVIEALRAYAAPTRTPTRGPDAIVAEVGRRQRRRSVAAAVAAVTVVVAGTTGVVQFLPDGAAPPAPSNDHVAQVAEGVPVGGPWREMAPSPLSPRHSSAGVWTGTELVVVGGLTDFICPPTVDCATNGEPSAEAAAYDPRTDTWRRLPDAPADVARPQDHEGLSHRITWTGEEVVVVRGDDYLALDPQSGTWEQGVLRTISADVSGELRGDGPGVYVHSSYDQTGSEPGWVDWVVDPVTRTRTALPRDPFGESYDRSTAWDGERFWLLSMDVEHHFAAHQPKPSRLAVLEDGTWRVVDEASPGVVHEQRIQWDGSRLVVPPRGDADGHAYDAITDSWTTLPAASAHDECRLTVAGQGPVWTAGDHGVLVAGHTVLTVPPCDDLLSTTSVTVWAGEELLVWGGAEPAGRDIWQVSARGLRWRPPAR